MGTTCNNVLTIDNTMKIEPKSCRRIILEPKLFDEAITMLKEPSCAIMGHLGLVLELKLFEMIIKTKFSRLKYLTFSKNNEY